MTARDRRTAWIATALLAAGFAAIWFYPTEFEAGVLPGTGFEGTPEGTARAEPPIPLGVFGIAGLIVALGLGLVWFLPWLGRRLTGAPGRFALGTGCVFLAAVGFGAFPALVGGVGMGGVGTQSFATFLVVLGTGLVLWLVAGVLGLVAVVRGPAPPAAPPRREA